MNRFSKIQLGLLLLAAAIACWESLRAWHLHRELASVAASIQNQNRELASQQATMTALEQRNRELQETERRAGNQTLLALMRGRNAVTTAASEAAAQAAQKSHAFGFALAKALDSSEHRQVNEDSQRAQMRAGLYQFFKLLNLPPHQCEAYIDLNIQKERRQSDRLSDLLQGKMTVAQALQERDDDDTEHEQLCREVLGENGMTLLNGIADGMRNEEAKRLIGLIQDNMGANQLNQDQSDRLQALFKAEIVTIHNDDIELFRPPAEWTQEIIARQQRILNQATAFLSPGQLDTLKNLAAYDLAEREKGMAARRTALGMK
jgi:hypothetical protein